MLHQDAELAGDGVEVAREGGLLRRLKQMLACMQVLQTRMHSPTRRGR